MGGKTEFCSVTFVSFTSDLHFTRSKNILFTAGQQFYLLVLDKYITEKNIIETLPAKLCPTPIHCISGTGIGFF